MKGTIVLNNCSGQVDEGDKDETTEFAGVFKEEASELLEEFESSLLELEKNSEDEELTRKIFRVLHTLKGSGAMFGFEDISEFSHELENVFDLVQKGKVAVSKGIIDLSLSAVDVIKKMLEKESNEEVKSRCFEIVKQIKKSAVEKGKPGKEKTYRIRFRPGFEIQRTGTDLISLLSELRALGYGEAAAHTGDIPVLEDIVPDGFYLYWDIVLTTTAGINAIRDVFRLIENNAEIKIDVIDEGKNLEEEEDYKKLGYILMERGDLSEEQVSRVLSSKKRIGESLVEEGFVEGEKVESALVEQHHVRELRRKRKNNESIITLRVSSEKADKLVNLVGELVTLQARLARSCRRLKDPELAVLSEEAERLIWDLRDNTMSIRMVPIGYSSGRFSRLVRDLSRDLGKEAELVVEGGETELDKTVIERLNDPLVHLIRNCVDHGIESPEDRKELGKPRIGSIHLSASYSGAHVTIVIKDDGTGINPESIKTRAVEKGLLKAGVELSHKEIFGLLFEAGFSTAREVTSVSGRGVGMEVVRKNIDALRGAIQVESKKDIGTTITLKIPLTLAIIDGLLVNIGDEHFIFPLSMVEEIVELTAEDIVRRHGRHIINIRGRIVPYIILREYFDIAGKAPGILQIVVAEVEERKVGFVVDKVIGKHQTVIKSLGKVYQNVEGLSGATILGDGTVALILDVSKLARLVEIQERRASVK